MRKIAASYIYPITSNPIKNGIIVLDDNGKIIDLIDNKGVLIDSEGVEFYGGMLVPGFINSHCHLELSCYKGFIEKNLHLHGFIPSLTEKRNQFTDKEKHSWINKADKIMFCNGISAVGDISNTLDTIEVKTNSHICYHTFVEIFGSDSNMALNNFKKGTLLYDEFIKNNLYASVVPHSPYSVSEKLFTHIKEHNKIYSDVISIHNQESPFENELFQTKSGKLAEMIIKLGGSVNDWNNSGKNSLESVIDLLNNDINIILVHNTFTKQKDIDSVEKYLSDIYWCLCPNSNLYIENCLPDINLFYKNMLKITIGTDSYASNDSLCILEEIKTIALNFPEIPVDILLLWATFNGAEALKINDHFGSFEIGKKPGVVLIENADLKNMKLNKSTTCRRLV
ncbi:MAG: amidohydrolase family protein [Bacteroidota bacterium]